jgi:hypothetical protein
MWLGLRRGACRAGEFGSVFVGRLNSEIRVGVFVASGEACAEGEHDARGELVSSLMS